MSIGILGSADVGQKLGNRFVELGHSVKIGTRDSNQDEVKGWVKKNEKQTSAGTFSQAATFGQLIVIATSRTGTVDPLGCAIQRILSKNCN